MASFGSIGGRSLLQGFRSGRVTLGGVAATPSSVVLAASGDAVALAGAAAGFAGGFPPTRLVPVEGAAEAALEPAGGGCSGWTPVAGSSEASGDFSVADGELVDVAECRGEDGSFEERELATSQPLFVHSLRGGDWRVLRWLRGHEPPVLATEGNLLAVGERASAGRMRVTILDLASGALVARFGAPLGYLSFASGRRLVLSVPAPRGEASPRAAAAQAPMVAPVRPTLYRLQLYALSGRPLAYIGTVEGLALVSHMHVLIDETVEGHAGPRRAQHPRRLEAPADRFRWAGANT